MTGLKSYRRDASIPARAGERELCPPTPDELRALVQRHLVPAGNPAPERAELVYARWKPGTAITAVYAVSTGDGRETLVTYKRYRGDKARSIERSYEPDEHVEREASALLPFHVDVDAGACLYALPADRELPGLARAFDLQRTARLLAREFPGKLRWRRSSAHLLRYKPEHRAVLRLDLVLRDERDELVEARCALRVLPPAEGERVVAARAAAFAGARARLAPELVRTEPRTGLLFERWLDVETFPGDSFDHAADAGALLARLHADAPGPRHDAPRIRQDGAELFAFEPALAARAARLAPPPVARPSTWIHGDLHPDQVARRRDGSGWTVLDLDAVRPGEAVEDLAAWIADALAARRATSLADAGALLLAAYVRAGGREPARDQLACYVAQELRERAAASLRRLEEHAVERARELLDLAVEMEAR
ncbi:MAG: hypothetical protein IPJ77_16710 [Planctomycetes bacterium]|nr:hypothetical protein [Planctomycetota bacterium]